MYTEYLINYIVNWLIEYCNKSDQTGFVVGVSGGIDSAVTSVLCAKTGKPTILVDLPILQPEDQIKRSSEHIKWVTNKFKNVNGLKINLTSVFNTFQNIMPDKFRNDLSMANARSRIRMTALYAIASNAGMLVVGTGNKVEDFGIGFYTKYGDGGVDISPLADLMKSKIYVIGKKMGIHESIINAAPTDGLWQDNRSDESQIGASYDELEWAMNFLSRNENLSKLKKRKKYVLSIYKKLRKKNLHKNKSAPICVIPKNLL